MRTIAENHADGHQGGSRASDDPFDDVMRARIGEDLRNLYTDVVDCDQPRSLLDMAAAIDACRSGEAFRD